MSVMTILDEFIVQPVLSDEREMIMAFDEVEDHSESLFRPFFKVPEINKKQISLPSGSRLSPFKCIIMKTEPSFDWVNTAAMLPKNLSYGHYWHLLQIKKAYSLFGLETWCAAPGTLAEDQYGEVVMPAVMSVGRRDRALLTKVSGFAFACIPILLVAN